MAARNIPWISPEEYLDREEVATTRHMYHAGVVTAMAGGSLAHGRLAVNLTGTLYAALGVLVVIWLTLGKWMNAWDAGLWLAAFGLLELDVLHSEDINNIV